LLDAWTSLDIDNLGRKGKKEGAMKNFQGSNIVID
jgi:hypothetical protein